MKQVFEYMMHRTREGIQTPEWVEDGGYFQHPTSNTYCMIVDSDRSYYIPDSLVEITKEDLVDRITEINAIVPIRIRTEDGKIDLKADGIESYVNDWWNENIN